MRKTAQVVLTAALLVLSGCLWLGGETTPETEPDPTPTPIVSEGAPLAPPPMTIEEARKHPVFGAYVPDEAPEGFTTWSATLFSGDNETLHINYEGERKHLTLLVHKTTPYYDAHIVDLDKPETYDMSLYTVPYMDSVPGELREIVNCPIFRYEDFTVEAVMARAANSAEPEDEAMAIESFGVLYGDGVIVEVSAKQLSAEKVYDILSDLGK